ncbi:MAG: hypothetical protein J5477_01215 [Schwartzia sp.]|nr:hypothetical protein [Schwartzia sp. (in: firmicutes)]MBR5163615.1 hypothetical protein [Schwartzia sp. (in: firmicutes)]
MLAIEGYYDGLSFQPLEKPRAKTNQRVIITIMDDFVEAPKAACNKRAEIAKQVRGILAEYADPKLREQEKGAWERAAVEKYGNI